MNRKIAIVIPLLLMMMACATAPLTPKQRVIWAANVYNAQYDLYLEQVLDKDIPYDIRQTIKADPTLITQEMVRTDISEEQRKILRVKKEILIELHPLLLMAAKYADQGMVPPDELEADLINLVNRLVDAIGD